MKCLACGKEFDDTVHRDCPECGFAALHIVGDVDIMENPLLRQMVEEYRKAHLNNKEIFVLTNQIIDFSGEIKSQYLSLGLLNQMENGKIAWTEQAFSRVSEEVVNLIIGVSANGGEIKLGAAINMKAPKGNDFWRIGVSRHESDTIQIHLYCDGDITSSDKVVI